MEYRFLGASGFKVSALGFGAYYPYWNWAVRGAYSIAGGGGLAPSQRGA
jgi:aryl-alcohol dehydrogenase-like predicted oxidoreductase